MEPEVLTNLLAHPHPAPACPPVPPPLPLAALLGVIGVPAALWSEGAIVAAAMPGGAATTPDALLAALGPEVREAAAAFMAEPRAGELVVGGGARPLVALLWRPLGEGWWLFTAGAANPDDPAAERRRSLVAELSHEAKTPLVSIRGYLDLLRARTQLDERQRSYVARALEEADRQEAVLDAWLHAAATAGGRLTVEPAATDLVALIDHVATTFRTLHPTRRLELDMPSTLSAWADGPRLAEVLTNLVDNASRYAFADAPVRIEARAHAGEVQVAVIDRGPGIPADELARLFEPFYRARGTDGPGTGLGLAIAEAILRAHGGRIWAQSEPGCGSTFAFALPAERRTP